MGDPSKREELQALLQEAQAANEARITEAVAQSESRMVNQLQQLSLQLQEFIVGFNKNQGKDSDAGASSNVGNQPYRPENRPNQLTGNSVVPRYTKLDFPTFDGSEDPLIWLHRCEKFFSNQRTNEVDKVGLAAFHLLGEAQLWYHQVEQEYPSVDWSEFKEYCALRFGPPLGSNPLGDLVNLKQTGSIEEYQRPFQERLVRASKCVRVDQQVSLFTAGLIDSIRLDVEMCSPPDLVHAMNIARAFEKKQKLVRATSSRRETWQGTKGYFSTTTSSTIPTPKGSNAPGGITEPKLVSSSAPFIKKLSRAEMAERRAKGLCYNCDELYSIGHQCKKLFWLELADLDDEEPDHKDAQEPEISLYAITGQKNARTMQLLAIMKGQPLLSLVDSGSTHNFISYTAAQHLGMQVQPGTSAKVSVAKGEKVYSKGTCPSVSFYIHNQNFEADFFVIPLDGFDIVLGVIWLQTLGPILWDFVTLEMSFTSNGKQVVFQGQQTRSKLQLQLLHDLDEHHSKLEQKDEIEKQRADMLRQGIIRPSRSPFSSPVLLVRKHDGTWRFCVDYRELNAKTVKDKFLIPVVDELLDELYESRYFTKLDLKSGYHQVRMDPLDIEKTAFRTHHDHFEFLVMPFGLSNAPSTFQALMNE
uniref:Reverse transcriptase domain-containing protein n=1 Tax=Nicotiana tabacum TaxID=4097 RepID=A0A1S3X3P8_TOBAC